MRIVSAIIAGSYAMPLLLAAVASAQDDHCEGFSFAGECDNSAQGNDTTTGEAARPPAMDRDAINVSGLVPLDELRRRPYQGFWAMDFRFHSAEFGFPLSLLHVTGERMTEPPESLGVEPRLGEVDGTSLFLGLHANYYIPLLGYSTHASFGLLPELHLALGGPTGSQGEAGRSDFNRISTMVQVPVFAMFRVGGHASRYGRFGLGAGAGFGAKLTRIRLEAPAPDSPTYIAPAFRLELALPIVKVGYEATVAKHETAQPGNGHLAYATQTVTIAFTVKPDPEN